MNLDELKVLWDAQHEERLFGFKTADLHAIVRRRSSEFAATAACRYRVEIIISTLCGVLMLLVAGIARYGRDGLGWSRWPKVPPSGWDLAALLVAAALWFYFALYLNLARVRLQQRSETFDFSLCGDIDRALAGLEFQIAIGRGILWRGLVPVGLAAALWVATLFRLSGGPAWSGMVGAAAVVIALAAELARQQDIIRARYEPQQGELTALRRKLTEADH